MDGLSYESAAMIAPIQASTSMNHETKCPFKAGDTVVYRPSNKGRGAIIMTDLAALKPGSKYKIARIDDGVSVVVEGFESAVGGGLYWTEFSQP